MKHRVVNWASAGFVIACGWIIYSFAVPPEFFITSLRQPLVEAAVCISCPISYAGRYFPLYFWWIPPINAATYALIGLIAETLRKAAGLRMAV